MPIAVTLHQVTGADPRQRAHIDRAVECLTRAVNDPAFAQGVIAARYRETRWQASGGGWHALTPDQILKRVQAGRERGTPIDATIDLHLDLIDTEPGVLGSTTLGKLPIRPGRRFIDACVASGDVAQLAGHLLHEWCHVSGFFHHPDNAARGDTAYVLGDLVRAIAERQSDVLGAPEIAAIVAAEGCGCDGATHQEGAADRGSLPDE